MDAMDIARQLARGGRVHELSGYAGRTFRLFAPHATTILTVYRSSSLQRREQRALESLADVEGLPKVIEWSVDTEAAWGLFEDAGAWNLATLPSSSGPARKRPTAQMYTRIAQLERAASAGPSIGCHIFSS